MKKLVVYLDTSIINFLFADDAPEKKEVTVDFFKRIVEKSIFDIWISPVVIDEINKTKDVEKKKTLLNVIKKYDLKILSIESFKEEIEHLAKIYIDKRIFPLKKIEDALHVSISTIFQMDILLSWNYKHLANVNKERQIISVNFNEGYNKPLKIITPMEAAYE